MTPCSCGKTPTVIKDKLCLHGVCYWYCHCECGAAGPLEPSRELAIKAWDKRREEEQNEKALSSQTQMV